MARLVTPAHSPVEVRVLMALCLAGLVWRVLFRSAFTAREYGFAEGLRAVLRIPVGNVIAIVSGRRAFAAYLGTLSGHAVRWDKTVHRGHPALAAGPHKAAA